MNTKPLVTSALVSLCALCLAGPARAEGEGTVAAEQHFQNAVELMKVDNCSEAVPEFLESQKLEPSAATLVNLATCYARLGRKATAFKTYRQGAAGAAAEKNEALRERALQAMAILGPTLTKLQIVTNAATPLSIRVNGEVLSNYDGLPIPLDPGESVIEAAAPGHEPWRRSVTADDLGATIVIEVPDLRPTPHPAVAAPPVPSDRPLPRPVDLRLPGAIIGGAGIASIIIGSVFGVSAKNSYNDSQPYCSANRCTQSGIELRDRAYDKAAVSTITISVGLVAVAAGAVLWLTSPAAPPAARRANIGQPPIRIGTDGFGMAVEGAR